MMRRETGAGGWFESWVGRRWLEVGGWMIVGVLWLVPVMEGRAQSTYTVPQGIEVQNKAQHQQPVKVRSPRVTVILKDSTLDYVLRVLAQQSRQQIAYNNAIPAFAKRVNVRVVDMHLMDALATVLKGTELVVSLAPDGETVVVRIPEGKTSARVLQEVGSIVGVVTDSASGDGIVGVTVSVQGTKLVGATGSKGDFTIANVTPGEYIVTFKLLGYMSVTRTVRVEDGKRVAVRVVLRQQANILSGVVTTATGQLRRTEIGNDITTIKVDSIMKTMPVSTLTELLATRVPGLSAAPTSGAPGAPSRVRIRGVSSINATNDPIVILDGVRMYARQIQDGGNLGFGADQEVEKLQSPSPLDQIDPNSIETVEVLKGPSAVALYGTDAANGVFIITTKRGQAGRTQWSLNADWGQETMPGKWPINYWLFGERWTVTGSTIGGRCNLDQVGRSLIRFGGNGCRPDSLATYQILNDSRTTVFGTGTTRRYRGDLRGGTRGLTYAFSGSTSHIVGLLKMPDIDVALLGQRGESVPDWQRQPQANEQQNGTANVMVDVNPRLRVSFTTVLNRTETRSTPLQAAGNRATKLEPSDANTIGSGLLRAIPNFRQQNTSRQLRSSNALNINMTPRSWLSTTATAGVDVTDRQGLEILKNGDCGRVFGVISFAGCGRSIYGHWLNMQGTDMVTTAVLGATVPVHSGRWISVVTSIGGNFNRNESKGGRQLGDSIPVGATSGSQAEYQSFSENNDTRSVAGFYLETRLGFMDRLYLPLAIRQDAGSGLGANVRPTFPKLGLSYVVSDQSAFRRIPVLGDIRTLRLRAAYGQSGVQPPAQVKLRTYSQNTAPIDGKTVTIVDRSTFGNPALRPERSSEWEGGADADLLDDRVRITVTMYRKRTLDMFINIDVPPSVDGGGSQTINVGNVRNNGLELSVGATLLQRRAMFWRADVNLARNSNRLTKLSEQQQTLTNEGGNGGASGIRFVVGYPLYGVWARPLVGFQDLNGDGIITTSDNVQWNDVAEVQLADEPVYLGAPYPNFESSLHNSMTIAGSFTIGAAFNYQHGLTQTMTTGLLGDFGQGRSDPTLPLVTQAYAAVGTGRCFAVCSDAGLVQTVSTLRFDALSIGYILPRVITSHFLSGRTVRLSLQGTNLGLWTNYRGKDPNVNAAMSERVIDNGVIPRARLWQISVGIN